jgi:dimethylaniline monooxygenase (N-oxide forming)
LPRYAKNGTTTDQAQTLRTIFILVTVFTWFPNLGNWLYDKIVRSISAKAFPTSAKTWKLSPAPSLSISNALIADDIYALFESGFAEPVAAVRRVVGEKQVEMSDGRVLENIDTIIFCTGYETSIPFLPKGINPYPQPGRVADLYRGTFPIHADAGIRNSIAYLGHGSVSYPGFTQYELQSMAISQTWLGNSPLPSLAELRQWHADHLDWRNSLMKQHRVDTFHEFFMPFAPHFKWLHDTAGTGVFEHFGWLSPRAWSFWWKDRKFYSLCLNGVPSAAIFRLFDMGKRKPLPWEEAKEVIVANNEKAEQDRKRRLEGKKKR